MFPQTPNLSQTLFQARPSRLFISTAMGCLLLASLRFWLLPGAEAGTAHLMMLWLVRGAGIFAAWGLIYECLHRWGRLRSFHWGELHFWGSFFSLVGVLGALYLQDSLWGEWIYRALHSEGKVVWESVLLNMKYATVMGLVSLSLWQIWGVLRTLIAWLEAKAYDFFEQKA